MCVKSLREGEEKGEKELLTFENEIRYAEEGFKNRLLN